MDLLTIAFVGAGNLATHLAKALHSAGHHIRSVCSPSGISASDLADQMGSACTCISKLEDLPQVDLYILAVPDDTLPSIITQWPRHCQSGVVVHTSGSVSITELSPLKQNYGVFYPLQTFSKHRPLDFSVIPCFIEADSEDTTQKLVTLAQTISKSVRRLDSRGRLQLHLSAVFACNFVNHLYDFSSRLLKTKGIASEWLHPLIHETAMKALTLSPHDAQTGPALRGDKSVMDKHLSLLSDMPDWQKVYELLSKSIYQTFHP